MADARVASSDSLLPGKGHTPNYGLVESESEKFTKSIKYTESSDRWHVVTMCALIACLASMAAGMSISFSSILINELSTSQDAWFIDPNGLRASVIGVSMMHWSVCALLCLACHHAMAWQLKV